MTEKENVYNLNFKLQWLFVVVCLLAWLAWLSVEKFGDYNSQHRILTVIIALVSYPIYRFFNVYSLRCGYYGAFSRILGAWLTLLATLSILGFITKTSTAYSREVFLTWTVGGLVFQLLVMPLQRHIASFLINKYTKNNKVIVIGAGKLANELLSRLSAIRSEQVLGIVVTEECPDECLVTPGYKRLGNIENLAEIIAEMDINKVYVALDERDNTDIRNLYIDLLDKNVDLIWAPDLSDLILLQHSIDDLEGLPLIRLSECPLTSNQFMGLVKNTFDRVAALLLIVLLLPFYIAVAVIIRLDSKGPAIYKQARHGLNGKVFTLYKFRSMTIDNNKVFQQASKNDHRVTAVGRFIRKTSIDELPQFFNVLKGDMSLVGPRPHPVELNDFYVNKIQAYMARHKIKPGITGLAQVQGLRGETEILDKMMRRFELDLEYINNWTLVLDLKILLKTPRALFSENAY